MIPFPAVCDQCGQSFIDAFGGTREGRICLAGKSRPGCPVCGGNISLPHGRYGFLGHIIRLLSRPQVGEADLNKLDQLMTRLEEGRISLDQCRETIVSDHEKFLFLAQICDWYKSSPGPSACALGGVFRDLIAAVRAYLPGREKNYTSFEHAANEHCLLAWDTRSPEHKAHLEHLVLASPDHQASQGGRSRMRQLKKARQRLKRKLR
jgi:hypothetical protein